MTAAEMLAQEARQTWIVASAEAILADLLCRLSAREALVALVGEAVADTLAGIEDGDELAALQKQVLRMAEREESPSPRTEPQG